MSANHDSRQAIGLPANPDHWPNFTKHLVEQGYRISLWAQIDFPSVVPTYYVGLEGPDGFRKATRLSDVRHWLPQGITTLYREALAFQKAMADQIAKAQAEKETIDHGTEKNVLDGAGGIVG